MSKKTKSLSGVFKHAELEEIMGSKTAIKRAVESGVIIKISRAFYASPDTPLNKSFYLIIKSFYKNALISKRSLLYHYKLTTDQPNLIDIDVEASSKLRKSTDLINVYRTNKIFNTTFDDFNLVKLKCYSVERALFEVLYFEKTPGQLTAEVIHNYLALFKYEPAIIHKIAQKFGKRGLDLANLIQVLSRNKFNKVS